MRGKRSLTAYIFMALGLAIAVIVVSTLTALARPEILIFPYLTQVGNTKIYSESPLSLSIEDIVKLSDARVSSSKIFSSDVLGRPIFLTSGGWRWSVLSVGASDAFALTRPLGESIVINRSDVLSDVVWDGSTVPLKRKLSDVITHERTHILIRSKFGKTADRTFPGWLREGYCDFVAGSSTLSESEAAELSKNAPGSPALFYFNSRKRVESELRANGGSVEALFSQARITS